MGSWADSMLLLFALPPNDVEILYAAVDSACKGRCVLSTRTFVVGEGVPRSLSDYLLLRYTDTSLSCTTKVNVADARVVYRRKLWGIERIASFRAIVSGCGFSGDVSGTYRDRISPSDVGAVKVEGVSPPEPPPGGTLEMLVSAAVVFGVLYAFYTIEGR